jgi:modulator of FtsH protease HflK
MEKVFGGTDKVILDQAGGQSVLPYLPLPQLAPKSSEGDEK